jgi:hypothetical protein
VAEWGFTQLRLNAIQIDREPANRASARVAERLGAVITGSRLVQHEGTEIELVRHTLTSPSQPANQHQRLLQCPRRRVDATPARRWPAGNGSGGSRHFGDKAPRSSRFRERFSVGPGVRF